MGDEAGAAAVRDRFEARRREFREEQIQRSFYELSEGADASVAKAERAQALARTLARSIRTAVDRGRLPFDGMSIPHI